MAKKSNQIVGLDIGSTKISVFVGELQQNGKIEINGFGIAPSRGLKRGIVTDIAKTEQSIRRAVSEAEQMANTEINEVFVGIAGGHIQSRNCKGRIQVKGSEVSAEDVQRAINKALNEAVPDDREVIHILVREFVLDEVKGIKSPAGMCGSELEAHIHVVTGASSCSQNLIRCANRCGLTVNDTILQQLASAEAVLTSGEKEMGTAVIDIGGGTTDIVIYYEDSVVYTAVLPFGGNFITHDISKVLGTPLPEAERIKQLYGSCNPRNVSRDDTVFIPGVGGREGKVISRQLLADIIEHRVEEIFGQAYGEIERSGFFDLIATGGCVITGGSSLLEGIPQIAEQIFGLPVRLGKPQSDGGVAPMIKSPLYATGVGLLQLGNIRKYENNFLEEDEPGDRAIFSTFKKWLRDAFHFFE